VIIILILPVLVGLITLGAVALSLGAVAISALTGIGASLLYGEGEEAEVTELPRVGPLRLKAA